MSNQPASKHPVSDVSYKVGEECSYWLKFGEYVQQQAIEDGWLDAQGKLTSTGLQAIISEQEMVKKRDDMIAALPSKNYGFKGKIKIKRSSRRNYLQASSAHSASNKEKSVFIKEIKALLAKINGKFVYFAEKDEDYRLVVRISNEKGSVTSHTFTGKISDIKRELDGLIGQYD